MSLLPSDPDTSVTETSSPRVLGVDSDAAEDLIDALSSDTAREILTALHEEPATPSQLAERVDTTLQNVQYHLEQLTEAGAVEVVDTVYSAKGREMDVYGPADRPLVIYAGEQSRTPSLRAALSRLLGGVGVLGVASLFVQSLLGDGDGSAYNLESSADGAGNASGQTPVAPVENTPAADEAVRTATETTAKFQTEAPVETATETVEAVTTVGPDGGGLPPGLVFFLGGLTALVFAVAIWYLWR